MAVSVDCCIFGCMMASALLLLPAQGEKKGQEGNSQKQH